METVSPSEDGLRDILARVDRIRDALDEGDAGFVEIALDGPLDDLWTTIEAAERGR